MEQPQALVVEDDRIVQLMVEVQLRQVGYSTTSAPSGAGALQILGRERFDLLVTDLCLDAVDGVQVMAAARALNPQIEIIVLTGAASLESAIAAVNHGARAYVRKPARSDEIAQLAYAALSRRQAQAAAGDAQRVAEAAADYRVASDRQHAGPLVVGSLSVDPRRYTATRDGQPMQLSRGEFDLLLYLIRHGDYVVTPEQVAADVLGYSCTADEAAALVKSRVHRLRQKIEANPSAPQMLISVRGRGYRLCTADAPPLA
jgi:DNA-binding response OmpR family regulator